MKGHVYVKSNIYITKKPKEAYMKRLIVVCALSICFVGIFPTSVWAQEDPEPYPWSLAEELGQCIRDPDCLDKLEIYSGIDYYWDAERIHAQQLHNSTIEAQPTEVYPTDPVTVTRYIEEVERTVIATQIVTVPTDVEITRIELVEVHIPVTRTITVTQQIPIHEVQTEQTEVPITNVVVIHNEVPVTRTVIFTHEIPVTRLVPITQEVVVTQVMPTLPLSRVQESPTILPQRPAPSWSLLRIWDFTCVRADFWPLFTLIIASAFMGAVLTLAVVAWRRRQKP